MLFQLHRELRRRSLGFGVVSSNCPGPCHTVYQQRVRREGEQPGEGASMLRSAQGANE